MPDNPETAVLAAPRMAMDSAVDMPSDAGLHSAAGATPRPLISLKEAAHRMYRLIARRRMVAPFGAADGGRSVPTSR
jgi:hypothetical protein